MSCNLLSGDVLKEVLPVTLLWPILPSICRRGSRYPRSHNTIRWIVRGFGRHAASASTYWNATCPFSNSSRARGSFTTNLPSPWLTAIEWIRPPRNSTARGVGRRHAGRNNLRHMTVDVVAEERRRLPGHHAQPPVRQQARLDKGLETVADAQDQAAPVEQAMYFLCNIFVIQNVGDKFTVCRPARRPPRSRRRARRYGTQRSPPSSGGSSRK